MRSGIIDYPDGPLNRKHHEYNYQAPKIALSPTVCERLKRELLRVSDRVIDRCLKEGFIDIELADDLRSASRSGSAAVK